MLVTCKNTPPYPDPLPCFCKVFIRERSKQSFDPGRRGGVVCWPIFGFHINPTKDRVVPNRSSREILQEAAKSHSFSNQLNRGFTLSPCSHIILGFWKKNQQSKLSLQHGENLNLVMKCNTKNYYWRFIIHYRKYCIKKFRVILFNPSSYESPFPYFKKKFLSKHKKIFQTMFRS